MSNWAIYSILAGVTYGLSAIPMRYVSNHSQMSMPSEFILLFSSLGALIGAIIYLISTKNIGHVLIINVNMKTVVIAAGAGLIGSMGSLFVIKALSYPESSVSNVMAIVNTNVLFALGFGVIMLRKMPVGVSVYRVGFGAVLMMVGVGMVCW
ncbi:MAG: hypothetical protein HQK91_13890 [Nitrospirae bacterium]|nr:hypothetical protein [Nitrospirota bacterium]MBF0542528.1 hypothetical protein [Nitrospirota bacterium]